MAKALTTADLRHLLAKRVLGPEGQGHRAFLLEEVQLGARRADAVSVGLWRSRGQLIEGFELKTNRRDWLKEYEDHAKAEPTMAICDHFWLVTVEGVLMPGELPPDWGLLIAKSRGRNLVIEKPAAALRDHKEVTHPVSREALVTLLRRVEVLGIDRLNEVRTEARKEAESRVGFDRRRSEDMVANSEARTRQFQEGWEAFHGALGLTPWAWQPTKEDLTLLGEVAEAIRNGDKGLERLRSRIVEVERTAGDLTGQLNDVLGKLNERIYGRGQAA